MKRLTHLPKPCPSQAPHGAARAMLAAVALLIGGVYPTASLAGEPRAVPLIDQRGAAFQLADLRGRRTLLTFVATRCTDACPIANDAFARVARQLRRDGIDARLVTVTLDPDYDTPFVMARLAHAFSANPRDWTFASGRPADVRVLMRSFGVVSRKGPAGVPELHSSFVYVLDSHVRLARTLLLSTGLTADAERALRAGGVTPP